jgi:hypothetical protein
MTDRDVKGIFCDSAYLAAALRNMADEAHADGQHADNYHLEEAADHIECLYADACDMQRTIKRLRAELAAKEKRAA